MLIINIFIAEWKRKRERKKYIKKEREKKKAALPVLDLSAEKRLKKYFEKF